MFTINDLFQHFHTHLLNNFFSYILLLLSSLLNKSMNFMLYVFDTINYKLKNLLDSYLMLTHLYSLISKALHNLSPQNMPRPLQSKTSKMTESHQHSKKLGKRCAKATSVISHIIDIAQSNPACRNRMALKSHPKKCPQANTST